MLGFVIQNLNSCLNMFIKLSKIKRKFRKIALKLFHSIENNNNSDFETKTIQDQICGHKNLQDHNLICGHKNLKHLTLSDNLLAKTIKVIKNLQGIN